jgi:hypothetical protein
MALRNCPECNNPERNCPERNNPEIFSGYFQDPHLAWSLSPSKSLFPSPSLVPFPL